MKTVLVLSAVMVLGVGVAVAKPKIKAGVAPITTGVVIRGQTLPPPAGASGTKAGANCDNFSTEDVDQNGVMTGASVQCGAGLNVTQALVGLPARFNSYCVVASPSKAGGRLIAAPISGNANHCDLSGIKPKAAIGNFGGAIWK